MFKIIIPLAIFVIVSCGPSVNPILQQRVNEYFDQKTSKNYQSSGKFQNVMPLAVGQWVLQRITDGKDKSIQKISIVGKESGGWIFEFYTLSQYNESTTQMLVKGIEETNKGDLNAIDILWVKTKDEKGNVTNIDAITLSIAKGMYKDLLSNIYVDVKNTIEAGSTTVAAGTFNGCSKIRSKSKVFGKTYEADGWYHSEVPVNGLVKSVAIDGSFTLELIDFGKTGAKSSI